MREAVKEQGKNKVASVIELVAWAIFFIGLIAGIIIGVFVGVLFLAVIYCAVAFIAGMVFLGLAEIIKLLQKLVDKA